MFSLFFPHRILCSMPSVYALIRGFWLYAWGTMSFIWDAVNLTPSRSSRWRHRPRRRKTTRRWKGERKKERQSNTTQRLWFWSGLWSFQWWFGFFPVTQIFWFCSTKEFQMCPLIHSVTLSLLHYCTNRWQPVNVLFPIISNWIIDSTDWFTNSVSF